MPTVLDALKNYEEHRDGVVSTGKLQDAKPRLTESRDH